MLKLGRRIYDSIDFEIYFPIKKSGNSTVITIQDLFDITHVKYFESINPDFIALIQGFLYKNKS